MKFKHVLIAIAALVFVACNNQKASNETTDEAKNQETEVIEITVADFYATPEQYVDKMVKISGTVSHVCKHGGKRLFLFNEDPEKTVKIEAGESIPQFDATCEGGEVNAEGYVRMLKIDEEYIAKMEAEMEAGEEATAEHKDGHGEGEHAEGEHGEGEHHHASAATLEEAHDAQANQIVKLREELAASEKGFIARYWIEGTSYKIMETEADHEGHEHADDGHTHE